MSETLWYYTGTVEHIAEIVRAYMIFEGKGKIAWFTSNEEYQTANEGTQYRIRVPRQAAAFSSYKDLKRRRKIDPTDQIKSANPDQWFGTSQPVLSDKWTSVETLTNEGWVPIDEAKKEWLRNLPIRRDVQKTLKKP
jgi:hypothetical protein